MKSEDFTCFDSSDFFRCCYLDIVLILKRRAESFKNVLKPLSHNTVIKNTFFFYTYIFDSISWINVGYLYIFIRVYMNYTYFWAYGVTYPSTNDMDKMRMNLFCLLLSQFSNQTITIWICLYVRFYLARSPAYLWQFAYIKTF